MQKYHWLQLQVVEPAVERPKLVEAPKLEVEGLQLVVERLQPEVVAPQQVVQQRERELQEQLRFVHEREYEMP